MSPDATPQAAVKPPSDERRPHRHSPHETPAATHDLASEIPAPDSHNSVRGATLQDAFLNALRREKIDTVIYFSDGSQERGTVRAFDTFTILLEHRASGKTQLIYKHAVARIFPTRAPSLSPANKSAPAKS